MTVYSINMSGRAIQRENPQYNIETVSKVYADVNATLGAEWFDSEHWEIPTGNPDKYEIASWIGTGKYSDVFIGYDGNTKVALKVLKPVRPQKYNREAKILYDLRDGTNIVKLIEIVQNPLSHQYTLVSEYIENYDYTKLYRSFSDNDCRYYLFQLMRALQYSHSHGIMHRDVKPQNIMYDPETKKLRLIDWGLAEFYHPKTRYNIHVASRHFKAMELLVDYQCYDYSVDIWSFGVTMASIIFERMPFFRGSDDFDMVAKICAVLGKNDLNRYLKKYGIDLPEQMERKLPKTPKERKDLSCFAIQNKLTSVEAIDLINACLRYDHTERITADQALLHPYFDPVRNL
ncbi:CMGC family protein kinase [Tritrichomonas foetus]|uniref:non-specific serine/threonine protein kinase n=1 Tax=Tritrichomonas foetus TaxID=1144522 RepID=A0A1J4K354_9EUKA|nr:CMGC family protein kinase [Tritrichomonas foetus]|eukprot:OHT05799.1 CMGC family protein kinase [Tritrichomonas foetus]